MSLRQKCILASVGLLLMGTAPVWSQISQSVDPDKDGTIDLAEAKNARRSYSTGSITTTMVHSTSANCVAG